MVQEDEVTQRRLLSGNNDRVQTKLQKAGTTALAFTLRVPASVLVTLAMRMASHCQEVGS